MNLEYEELRNGRSSFVGCQKNQKQDCFHSFAKQGFMVRHIYPARAYASENVMLQGFLQLLNVYDYA